MNAKQKTKKMRAAARSTPEEDPEFQIAPMIDILLVLLIFFMSISSSEVLQVNKDVILPVAKDAKEKDQGTAGKGQATVNILWSNIGNTGTVEFEEKKYGDPGQLTPILSNKVQATPNMRVLIRADKSVRYEYLRAVMVACGNAGVGNVTFSVVDKDGSGAPPAP